MHVTPASLRLILNAVPEEAQDPCSAPPARPARSLREQAMRALIGQSTNNICAALREPSLSPWARAEVVSLLTELPKAPARPDVMADWIESREAISGTLRGMCLGPSGFFPRPADEPLLAPWLLLLSTVDWAKQSQTDWDKNTQDALEALETGCLRKIEGRRLAREHRRGRGTKLR